jgi:protein involved in polysaccharide export with SLBB domain
VAGLKVSHLTEILRQRYRKYIRDPQVGVLVKRAGTFFVDGAVRRPGSYPLNRTYSLNQALIAAGGVDFNLAKNSEITIFHPHEDAVVEATVQWI